MHLLQLVGKPLLATELILFQGQDELLIVLDSVPEKYTLKFKVFCKIFVA